MSTATSLNIALLPSSTITQRAIEMSEKISGSVGTHFSLNTTTLLPHITIYQVHVPNTSIEKVTQQLTNIASHTNPFTITLRTVSVNYKTFLFWECDKSVDLQNFHEETVKQINPFRNGLVLPVLKSVTGLTEEDKKDVEQFGALLIGKRYHPHITITRLQKPEDAPFACKLLQEDNVGKFLVDRFILGYLGDHGTVTGVIDTYKLSR